MVSCNESHYVVANHLILVGIDIVYSRDMETDTSKDRLPTSHRVCADDGM